MKYLFALMDDQTRFWIAQEVADIKFTADLRPLFKLGKAVAQTQPLTLITDGAPNFHEAYTKEFYVRKMGTEHIREIHIAGKVHNNKMERMNGEIRDRERVMRTLEKSVMRKCFGQSLLLKFFPNVEQSFVHVVSSRQRPFLEYPWLRAKGQ
jgi:hypothetical protein